MKVRILLIKLLSPGGTTEIINLLVAGNRVDPGRWRSLASIIAGSPAPQGHHDFLGQIIRMRTRKPALTVISPDTRREIFEQRLERLAVLNLTDTLNEPREPRPRVACFSLNNHFRRQPLPDRVPLLARHGRAVCSQGYVHNEVYEADAQLDQSPVRLIRFREGGVDLTTGKINASRGRMQVRSPSRVAVIGSGISGLSASWRLSKRYDVTLFEADNRLGGHANTRQVEIDGTQVAVDTGFIVFNPLNYPNFTALLEHLGVESAPSDMSFAASIDDGGFEYSSHAHGLFAQKRNFLRPRMWTMLSDLMRLYSDASKRDIEAETRSLNDFLIDEGYSDAFRNDHILPMCAAIWSSPATTMKQYPARTFFRFFRNHGLFKLVNRPGWRTVTGGSRNYVTALAGAIDGDIRLNARIQSVQRTDLGPVITFEDGRTERFDEIVFACHSDQALRLLADADEDETARLGAIAYQDNIAVLHTDTDLMPRRKKAWASWNYLQKRDGAGQEAISLTYWMNTLQPLTTEKPVLVTLNPETAPDPAKVLETETYSHPVFDQAAVEAQTRMPDIQGRGGIWYAGAWMGSGFHEDGLQAGLAVAEAIGAPVRPWGLVGCTSRIAWPGHLQHAQTAQTASVAAE